MRTLFTLTFIFLGLIYARTEPMRIYFEIEYHINDKKNHGFIDAPYEILTDEQKQKLIGKQDSFLKNSIYGDSVIIYEYLIQYKLADYAGNTISSFPCQDNIIKVAVKDLSNVKIINAYQEWPGNSIATNITIDDLIWLNSNNKLLDSFEFENCEIKAYGHKDYPEIESLLKELKLLYKSGNSNSLSDLLNKLKNKKVVIINFCG
ncbi:MAG TPA: hypothetical protein PKL31_11685 [Fulvivirga sp.]|nr:hypothetical protein [Fulvivirga sp.]